MNWACGPLWSVTLLFIIALIWVWLDPGGKLGLKEKEVKKNAA